MKNLLLSVILPVYNGEAYLPECLQSLSEQSYPDIEFICIDDGSTDDTPSILAKQAENDPRLRVIRTKNRGYGAACNLGFSQVKGQYIAIFEGDDFCSRDFYQSLMDIARSRDCDLVKSDYNEYTTSGNKKLRRLLPASLYGIVFAPGDKLDEFNFYSLLPSVWSAVYRRDLLEGIRFLETPGASFQDTSFSVLTTLKAKRAYFVDKAFVCYRQHPVQSIRSGQKACAILDEYRRIEQSLPVCPELFTAKFRSFLWNYRRLEPKEKAGFLTRASEELRRSAALYPSLIKPELYREGELLKLRLLLADPHEFHALFALRLDYSNTAKAEKGG